MFRSRYFSDCACRKPNLRADAPDPGRRNFLAGGAAALGLGAAGIAGAGSLRAQELEKEPAKKSRIDVHHHFLPRVHRAALRAHRMRGPRWSPRRSLREMDRNGIATAMLSQVQPGTWWGNESESRQLSRLINDYGASLVQKYPGRFGLFATISPPDIDGSLREIEYAFDTLKADGVGILTSYRGKYLGDTSFAPVYEVLNTRKAVVFVHPLAAHCCEWVVPGIPAASIEYATDLARTIAHLVFSGTAQDYPDIRWIFSHGGGTLPYLTPQLVRQHAWQKREHLPDGPLPELQKFYYEISQGHSPLQLAALLKMVPTSQLLYGTDFPYAHGAEVNSAIADWGFTETNLRAIERETALKLLPRLKSA